MNTKVSYAKSFFKSIMTSKMLTITLVMIAMFIIASAVSPYFLTVYNLQSVSRDLAFISIIAIVQSCLLILGDLDLSVGKIAALCGVISGMLMVQYDVSPVLALIFCLVLGMFCGVVNGLIVTKLKLNSVIVTIGMTGVYGGINIVLTKGSAITDMPKSIAFLGKGSLLGVPMPFIFMIIILVVIVFVMIYTRLGRYIYAIGNSREAANILGIKFNLIRITVFTVMGFFAAFTGLLMVARLGTAQPSIGEQWPLNSIASAVIGGIALTGGEGNPISAVIGAAIIALIQNMIVLFGVSIYWQSAVSGFVVVLAISVDPLTKMWREMQERRQRVKVPQFQINNIKKI